MKIEPAIFKSLIVLCSTAVTTAVFGQTTYTWTGAGDGTNFGTAGNWNPTGVPVGGSPSGDTAQWDGVTATNLVISCGTLPTVEYPSFVNFVLTANQTNSVQIISSIFSSPNLRIFGITNNSPDAAFVLGATNMANILNVAAQPAGAIHYWANNSAAPVTINPSVKLMAGGGAAYALEFGGTGDWVANNYLLNSAGPNVTIQVDGPGTVTWDPTGSPGAGGISSPLTISGGALILKGNHPRLGSLAITNNAIFKFDAPAQSQTLSGVISGPGLLQVNHGTLTLSGASTYTGNTILGGGELIVNAAEDAGAFGPLGVGGTISFNGGTLEFSTSNTFDYSSRFSAAAGQTYSFDTGGQNVTFASGLSSSGGTLTKVGAGTLTLAGVSTYTGNTTISAGRLLFQGPKVGTGNITVADGATLGITATATQVAPNMLTLGSSSGCTLDFDNVNSTTAALIAVGTLSTAGTTTINVQSGTLIVGSSYPLLTWTSGSTPMVGLGILNGYIGNLSFTGNTLELNITGRIAPPMLNFTNTGNSLRFSWSGNFKLQAQTNTVNTGLGTNWADYPGGGISPATVPMGVANGAAFFRLVSTP